MLPHLNSGWAVDQVTILLSQNVYLGYINRRRACCGNTVWVFIFLYLNFFRQDHDSTCMVMDEILYSAAQLTKNYAVFYLVDKNKVSDFNTMYEIYDDCTVMFFFRNRHILVDLGTGDNNKINWAMNDKQEFIDIVETVYLGAKKGKGLVVSPKDYSTSYRY